eukprot:TRINITY_DN9472_c1_g1_i3.p1 TRINITY_DN9472_c1_g1~~TRINITY_DN9472_c1_g1_i3.p1  ORF type:complete len:116 (-),score=11.91 TRINITY_DN9472_c1_g1_i3:218-565(-)
MILMLVRGEINSNGHHDPNKLLIVDLAIAIHVSLSYHLFHLFVCQFLTEVDHHMPQLTGRDVSILILVKYFKGLFELLLCISFLHFSCHEIQELCELNSPIPIHIHFANHVMQFF